MNISAKEYKYFPAFKTTDAELKGFSNLGEQVKDSILPIIELTQSRKTSKNPHRDISRRVQNIRDANGDRPLILDLTTEETLINDQIINLYNPENGYSNWVNFLKHVELDKIIPCINIIKNTSVADIALQATQLERNHGKLAFRVPLDNPQAIEYVTSIILGLEDPRSLILILNGGFLGQGRSDDFLNVMKSHIDKIQDITKTEMFFIQQSSCFPSSVSSTGYHTSENKGIFSNEDVLCDYLIDENSSLRNIISFGDFASIHPVRYPTRGGTFIPRIDLPLTDKFVYRRYRREDGGYITAAQKLVSDKEYENIGTWGDKQIELASQGTPEGLAPVFWIAVRMNIHITKQYLRTISKKR